MQVAEKQKISPWDVLEGHKTPAPLSWAWFGAVKHERKPMKYEEGFQELKYATIALEKPKSYYLDPPPLPPEDLEPAFNQNKDQNKTDQMNMMMRPGKFFIKKLFTFTFILTFLSKQKGKQSFEFSLPIQYKNVIKFVENCKQQD